MRLHFHLRPGVLALALAVTGLLAACQSTPSASSAPASAAGASPVALRQDAFKGLYEIVHSPAQNALFVASTPAFDKGTPGFVHRLDANDLTFKQTIQLPRRAFAVALNRKTGLLYVGNTLDGSLSVIDANTGELRQTIQLGAAASDDKMPHTRKVVIDERRNRVFVTSPGRDGKVWIVDGAAGKVLHTLDNTGTWSAGAAFDEGANRLYVSQGGIHEVLEIDPDAGRVLRQFSTGETRAVPTKPNESKHFFVNIALDSQGKRLFATDSSTDQLYVLDIATWKVLRQIPIGKGVLDVVYNPVRNEVYTTHRGVSSAEPTGTGGVTLIDGRTLAVKQAISLPVHPNSLALSADGQMLYVTVKAPHGDKHPAALKGAQDSVVKIRLS